MYTPKSLEYKPFVSIICVTYNRRPFIPFSLQCIRNQDYPNSRYEVIIVDDGTDKVKDLILEAKMSQVKYFELPEKMKLGKKRNYSHTLIDKRSRYITYFDDDDYHTPSRISHSIEMLIKNPTIMCAGSSEIYIFFKHIDQMYTFGPYSKTHATAGTFTFRVELLDITRYDDDACIAEECFFLKKFTIPIVQLDPSKTILVISHDQNTIDKKQILEKTNIFMRKSSKKIESFIFRDNEINIKHFFTCEMHDCLTHYEPGSIHYKPDALQQINELEEKLKKDRKLIESPIISKNSCINHKKHDTPVIKMVSQGNMDVMLSIDDVITILNKQQEEINNYKVQLNIE